jgi:hypothetical protein
MQSRFATTDDAKTLGALNAQLIRDEGQRLAKLLEMVPNLGCRAALYLHHDRGASIGMDPVVRTGSLRVNVE